MKIMAKSNRFDNHSNYVNKNHSCLESFSYIFLIFYFLIPQKYIKILLSTVYYS